MAHFLLIHGAWHGGWCWEGVIQWLAKAGYSAEAPTLPGHSPGDRRANITFQVYVDFLVDTLSRQRSPVILVGHSSAGLLLQAAAPQVAINIERLVFHNAVVVGVGQRQFDVVPPEEEAWMTTAANATFDRTIPVMESFLGSLLEPDDIPSFRETLLPRLVPQPLALFDSPVDTNLFDRLVISKTVLYARDEASFPSGSILAMAQRLGQYELVEIAGGHEVLFTRPEVVAQALIRIAGTG